MATESKTRIVFHPRTAEQLEPLPGAAQTDYRDVNFPHKGTLCLRVSRKSKTWCYLYPFRGAEKRAVLGQWPAMTYKAAFTRAAAAALCLPHSDPFAEQTAQREQVKAGYTWENLNAAWLAFKQPTLRASTYADYVAMNARIVAWFTAHGIVLVSDAKETDVIDLVRSYGTTEMSNQIRFRVLDLLSFAKAHRYITVHPIPDAKYVLPKHDTQRLRQRNREEGPKGEPAKLRAYKVDEVLELLRLLRTSPVDAAYCDLYEVQLLCGQRVNEVAKMKWDDLDLDGGWWTIPVGRLKVANHVPHRVKLIPQLVKLLRERERITDEWLSPEGKPAATASRRKHSPPKRTYVFWAKSPALSVYNTAFQIDDRLSKLLSFKLESHNLRRTFITLYEAAGAHRACPTGLQVNHRRQDVMTGTYSEYGFDDEKAAGMDVWAKFVRTTLTPGPRATTAPHAARARA